MLPGLTEIGGKASPPPRWWKRFDSPWEPVDWRGRAWTGQGPSWRSSHCHQARPPGTIEPRQRPVLHSCPTYIADNRSVKRFLEFERRWRSALSMRQRRPIPWESRRGRPARLRRRAALL